jgi:hypothetical protein
MDSSEEYLTFFHRGAIVLFLLKFDVVPDDEEEAGEKHRGEHPEKNDQKLGVEAAVLYIVAAVRYDNEGKKPVIHTVRSPGFGGFRAQQQNMIVRWIHEHERI